MGNICSRNKLQYDTVKSDSTLTYSVNQTDKEWTLLTSPEVEELLNQIHQCPFEDGRNRIIGSIQTRLLTSKNMLQILELLSSKSEKLRTLQVLSGNITDKNEGYKIILAHFDSADQNTVYHILLPRSQKSQ